MGEPITWRSLLAQGPAEALRPMAVGTEIFSRGLDKFQQTLLDQEAVNQGVLNRAEDAKVLSFKERLAAARTPQEVAAIQGELDAMRAGLGVRGRTAVLGQEEARQLQLQDVISKKNAFDDAELDRQQRPLVQQILGLAAKGDKLSSGMALQLLQQNPGLRNSAEISKAIVGGERDFTRFGWEGDKNARENRLADSTITMQGAQAGAARAQTEAAKYTLEVAKEDRTLAQAAAAKAANLKKLEVLGNPYAQDGAYTPERAVELQKLAVDLKLEHKPDEMQKVLQRVDSINRERIAKNELPLPMSVVKQALLQAEDSWWRYNEGPASSVEAQLRTYKGPSQSSRTGELADHYQAWLSASEQVADTPRPGNPPKGKVSGGVKGASTSISNGAGVLFPKPTR